MCINMYVYISTAASGEINRDLPPFRSSLQTKGEGIHMCVYV